MNKVIEGEEIGIKLVVAIDNLMKIIKMKEEVEGEIEGIEGIEGINRII